MIKKSLITLIYETASIQRWNDHIRPYTGFTELDKQAHKMFYAYVLAKCEGEHVDMQKLIEGGITEFFHRSILTDIKPPIYHKLMNEKGAQIDQWVIEQLEPAMRGIGGEFFERMKQYLCDPDYAALEKKILKAAHYFASNWEFRIIYPMNKETFDIEQVKVGTLRDLKACNTFPGFTRFERDAFLQDFCNLIGKLRYQQRWAKAVRLPETYVMGHMLVVAILSYFMTLELDNPCKSRLINNFLSGLFHDVPEALTRDIVSPIKKSVEGLGEILNEIETEQMHSVVYPMLPEEWHSEIEYYTVNEFASKIKKNGESVCVTSDEINEKYNNDKYCPIDGQIIRGCDHLSAYIEAFMSISYGVRSEQMVGGYNQLHDSYKNKTIGGIDFSIPFGYYDIV
ncbi:MAG: HD domain-containing protein [Oscillospiraceae bacterium]|nr:HD domain-containing protein [Oscillospiraceae bacterium]